MAVIIDKVEHLEQQVKDLSPEELARFRRWSTDFDGQAWDRQLQADVDSGKLDTLAEKALRALAAGRTTEL